MTTVLTSDPSETVEQNATMQIAVDHEPQIGMIKPLRLLKSLLIHPFKILKMILNKLVIDRTLWLTRTVEGIFRTTFFRFRIRCCIVIGRKLLKG
jgi:hypothetical protein